MSLSDTALVTLIQAKAYLRVNHASSLHVDAEFLGVGDGADTTFDLDNIPIEGSLILKVNDVLQVDPTHYSVSGATITFVTAPTLNHGITASYDYAAVADTFESYDDALVENLIAAATKKAEEYTGRAFVQRTVTEQHPGDGSAILKLYRQPVVTITSVSRHRYEQVGTGDGLIVVFTLDNTPIAGSVILYVDGVLQVITTNYTIDGATITFEAGSTPGDEAIVTANYNTAVVANYTERLHIGRLYRDTSWAQDYIYEIVYTTGYGADRAATQALVPDAVAAVLLILANLHENRVDHLKHETIAGLGTVVYDIPSKAKTLLDPLRVSVL